MNSMTHTFQQALANSLHSRFKSHMTIMIAREIIFLFVGHFTSTMQPSTQHIVTLTRYGTSSRVGWGGFLAHIGVDPPRQRR